MNRYHIALAAFVAIFVALMVSGRALSSTLVGVVLGEPTQDATPQRLPTPGNLNALSQAPSQKLGVVMHPLQRVYAPELASRQVQLAQSIGASIIEIDIHWAWVEPHNTGPAGWDVEQLSWLDDFLRKINGSGRDVVALVTETPCWASADPNRDCAAGRYDWRYPPRNPQDYADFLTRLVSRYGDRIKYWLIWGEPNTPARWATPDANAYTALLKAAYQAVKAADPTAVVISASLAPRDSGPSVFAYLDEMYTAGAKGYFDVLAYNAYTDGNPPTWYNPAFPAVSFSRSVPLIRQIMQAHGDSSPIWLTEVGWSTVSVDCTDCKVGTLPNTEAEQAVYMKEAVEIARRWDYVGAYFAYELVDMIRPPDSLVSVEYYYGLFRKDLTAKLAAHQFQELALSKKTFLPTITQGWLTPAALNDQRSRLAPSGIIVREQRLFAFSPRAYLPLVVGTGASCFKWYGQITLQDAVNQNRCVEIQAGVWTTTVQIAMGAGHTLTGQGTDATTLRAVQPWIGNGQALGTEAVVHNNGQPDVVIKNLTIDANNTATDGIGAHGRNMTVDSVRVTNARCDGIAIVASGWTVQRSTIENNGFACDTSGYPGAGIYIQRHDDDGYYRPRIVNNLIRNNGGPAIDVDRAWGGLISGNTLSGNWGWAAVSLIGSEWTVENNTIVHPLSANPEHFGHPECQVKRANNFSAGISICQSEGAEAFLAQNNAVLNNRVSAGHGIRLMGNDETNPTWTPRFNRIQGNDVTGATVGCLDDFEPGQSMAGQNTWSDNNCDGTPDSPPVYLWRLCPHSVSSAMVAGWKIGVAPANIVQERIDEFNANREDDGGAFHAGDTIPPGALVATNFDPQGTGTISWENYPVQTVVRSGSWGLFRAITAYTAPQPGACLLVFP